MSQPSNNNQVPNQTGAIFPDDPFGPIKDEKRYKSPAPREVGLIHQRSDVDSSVNSQHHTLGIGHNQASPGDHMHDGRTSRKIGQGLGLTLTGAAAGNTALNDLIRMLHLVIEFNDSHST